MGYYGPRYYPDYGYRGPAFWPGAFLAYQRRYQRGR